MSSTEPEFQQEYTRALQSYLDGKGEAALKRAYDLGRQAADAHLSILELAAIYHAALAALLAHCHTGEESARIVHQSGNFFGESLSRFDMAQRGFQEAVARLNELNATLGAANDELRSSREQLRALSAHIQSAREQERMRIAREIHDELGQMLTALKMDVAWMRKNLDQSHPALQNKLDAMAQLIDGSVQTTRRISADLRPSILDDLGLVAAIEWQLQEFQARSGVRCHFAPTLEAIDLSPECATAVFRIFQETLTNVARHARATRVEVTLESAAGDLLLQVSDNGRGITETELLDPESFGLIGMRERVHLLAGEIQIGGTPAKGTIVTVRIPLDGDRPG